MTILGISGSPRRGGNSELVLSSFLEGVARRGFETELIRLNDLSFRPCQACDRCRKTGRCVIKDDMQDLYPKIISCQGLVLSTPIFFGSMSAQLKMFIDRFQGWWHAKYNLKRPFISPGEERPSFLICVGALKKKEYCESAEKIADVFFHIVNLKKQGQLFYRGYDARGSISSDPANLEQASQCGFDFASGL